MSQASHEKEQRARETIQNLKTEITKLGRLVEQGATGSMGFRSHHWLSIAGATCNWAMKTSWSDTNWIVPRAGLWLDCRCWTEHQPGKHGEPTRSGHWVAPWGVTQVDPWRWDPAVEAFPWKSMGDPCAQLPLTVTKQMASLLSRPPWSEKACCDQSRLAVTDMVIYF